MRSILSADLGDVGITLGMHLGNNNSTLRPALAAAARTLAAEAPKAPKAATKSKNKPKAKAAAPEESPVPKRAKR